MTDGKHRKRIHLAARLPALDFDALARLARSAERGLFDFVVADGFTVLAALAAVTERVGLVGAVDTTDAEPFEVARQLATLDHLSDGRAGWTMVPSSEEFLAVVGKLWDSWDADAVVADVARGVYAEPARIHAVDHHGAAFDVRGVATLPVGPRGHPVLLGSDPRRLKVFSVVTFGGTPEQAAAELDLHARSDACDGVIVEPHPTAGGLDDFVDRVVPLLQERGVLGTEYRGFTLREHLGL